MANIGDKDSFLAIDDKGNFAITRNGITTNCHVSYRDGFPFDGCPPGEKFVVYSHGLNSRSTTPHVFFDDLTQRLVQQGINVIRPDFIGCGMSKESGSFVEDFTAKKGCQQLIDVILQFAPVASSIRLVARSMGIMPAALLSVDSTLPNLGYALDKIAIHAGAGRISKTIEYVFAQEVFYKNYGQKITYDQLDTNWYKYDNPNLPPQTKKPKRRSKKLGPTRRDMILEKLDKMWPEICHRPGKEIPLSFIKEKINYAGLLNDSCLNTKNILWIHGDNDLLVPYPMSGWSDICWLPKDNFIRVKGGTHELNTPEEMSQYMDRLVQFLTS